KVSALTLETKQRRPLPTSFSFSQSDAGAPPFLTTFLLGLPIAVRSSNFGTDHIHILMMRSSPRSFAESSIALFCFSNSLSLGSRPMRWTISRASSHHSSSPSSMLKTPPVSTLARNASLTRRSSTRSST
ncbi:hypothetical protein PIB30_060094, partial [Stylosanthes scabra]|nr:hypothetical protein [Stylosanthes scabra]